jgi:hypothetical protein
MGNYGNNIVYSDFGYWTFTGVSGNIVKLTGGYNPSTPDNAKNGNQVLDMVSGAGTAYQDFTVTGTPAPITFGGYFSSREPSSLYVNWTASVQIFALPSQTLVSTSTTRNFTVADASYPARNNWYLMYGSVTLPPGSYRYVVNLGDYGNFDASFAGFGCPVPVILTSFDARNVNDKAELIWNMADESAVSGYEIEKSADGIEFTPVKQMTVSPTSKYSFIDEGIPGISTVYYRVKITATNNKTTYSKIIRISFNLGNNFQVVPNPALNSITLQGVRKQGCVSVIDLSGKTILTKQIKPHVVEVDISSLHPGLYVVVYNDGATIQNRQFIKR